MTEAEIESFFRDIIVGFMITDLKRSVDAKTNFLTALGCLTYTEIIGSILPPLPDSFKIPKLPKGKEGNFYRCFFRLRSSVQLIATDSVFRKETKNRGVYQQLRHSMAHSYFPVVRKTENGVTTCASAVIARDGFIPVGDNKQILSPPIYIGENGRIAICTNNYTEELDELTKDVYKKTFVDKDDEYLKYMTTGYDHLFTNR